MQTLQLVLSTRFGSIKLNKLEPVAALAALWFTFVQKHPVDAHRILLACNSSNTQIFFTPTFTHYVASIGLSAGTKIGDHERQ